MAGGRAAMDVEERVLVLAGAKARVLATELAATRAVKEVENFILEEYLDV